MCETHIKKNQLNKWKKVVWTLNYLCAKNDGYNLPLGSINVYVPQLSLHHTNLYNVPMPANV